MRKDINNMTAGIPGTGISVIFYLVSILIMFLCEGLSRSQKRQGSDKDRILWLELKIVLCSVFSLWLTDWLMNYLLIPLADITNKSLSMIGRFHLPLHPLLIGLCLWLMLTVSLEVTAFLMRRQRIATPTADYSLGIGPNISPATKNLVG